MRTWERTSRHRFCGGCGAEIAEGEPVLVVSRVGSTWRLYRGTCCSGEAPPDLPVHVRCFDRTQPMVKLARIVLPFDFKARAAGEDRM